MDTLKINQKSVETPDKQRLDFLKDSKPATEWNAYFNKVLTDTFNKQLSRNDRLFLHIEGLATFSFFTNPDKKVVEVCELTNKAKYIMDDLAQESIEWHTKFGILSA